MSGIMLLLMLIMTKHSWGAEKFSSYSASTKMVTSVSDRPCPCNIALLIFPPYLSPSPAERIRAREGLHKWEWKQSQEQGREVRVQLWTGSTAQKKRGGRIRAHCARENREAEEDRVDLKRDPASTCLRCKKKDRSQQIVPFQRIPQLQQHKVRGLMKKPWKYFAGDTSRQPHRGIFWKSVTTVLIWARLIAGCTPRYCL